MIGCIRGKTGRLNFELVRRWDLLHADKIMMKRMIEICYFVRIEIYDLRFPDLFLRWEKLSRDFEPGKKYEAKLNEGKQVILNKQTGKKKEPKMKIRSRKRKI